MRALRPDPVGPDAELAMPDAKTRTPLRRAAAALACILLAPGCATSPGGAGTGSDPLEPVNRRVHAFNDGFDRLIGRPLARAYTKVVPDPADRAVTNFFDNLDDVSVLVNSGLQLKGRKFGVTAGRLTLNTTIGLLGLIDVAGKVGLEKENEDFGQTLGYWGLGPGPYIVLPLLGPSGVRDGFGRAVDFALYDPLSEIDDNATENSLRVLQAIDTRAAFLGASRMVDTAAVDPYAFTREAYRSRRAHQVYDGKPPPEAAPGGGPGADRAFDPFADEDEDLFDDGAGEAGD